MQVSLKEADKLKFPNKKHIKELLSHPPEPNTAPQPNIAPKPSSSEQYSLYLRGFIQLVAGPAGPNHGPGYGLMRLELAPWVLAELTQRGLHISSAADGINFSLGDYHSGHDCLIRPPDLEYFVHDLVKRELANQARKEQGWELQWAPWGREPRTVNSLMSLLSIWCRRQGREVMMRYPY